MTESRVILITAGSKGLGAAIARRFASDPHNRIVINYHSDKEAADSLLDELTSISPENRVNESGETGKTRRFVAIKADMASRHDINNLVASVLSTMGRLDIVISNAGWTRMSDFYNLADASDEADWDRCFNMNTKSHFFLFEACHPHLKQCKGCFIATASVAGVVPSGSSLPYAVSKAALIHLTNALARIAKPEVRVNSISPGVLLTDWGKQFPQAALDKVKEKNALKTFVTVEDVARSVHGLALNKSVTGQNLILDAGYSL